MIVWEKNGLFIGKEYVIKMIVISYLIDKMVVVKGIECFNILIGFKWIGKIMIVFEGKKIFLVGGEESYGLLVGEYVCDKDVVVFCVMIVEMVVYYKD